MLEGEQKKFHGVVQKKCISGVGHTVEDTSQKG